MDQLPRRNEVVVDPVHQGIQAVGIDALLAEYRAYLKLYAQAQLNLRRQPHVDASDIAQDALLAAFQRYGSFHGASTPELKAWLRQIVASKIIDRIRHEHAAKRDVRRQVLLSGLSSGVVSQAWPGSVSTPSAKLSREEQSLRIVNALERLPQDYRQVIILRQFNQLAFREIGLRLDRTCSAARMLFARAIDRLRRELQELADER